MTLPKRGGNRAVNSTLRNTERYRAKPNGVTISYSLCTHYQRRLAAKFQFGALMTEPGKHFLQHLFSDSLLTNPTGYAIIPINQLVRLVFGERSTNRHEELLPCASQTQLPLWPNVHFPGCCYGRVLCRAHGSAFLREPLSP